MLGPLKESECTALKVPTVQREHREGDIPCDADAVDSRAMGARRGLLTQPGSQRGASWRRVSRPTAILLVRRFPLRTEVRTGHVLLFPKGCAISCPLASPLLCAPTLQHTAKHQEGSRPKDVRSGQGTTLRTSGSQSRALLPSSGRTEKYSAPSRAAVLNLFWHQGPVMRKTVFPQTEGDGGWREMVSG